MTAMGKCRTLLLLCTLAAPLATGAEGVVEAPIGQAVERELPGEGAFSRWSPFRRKRPRRLSRPRR